MPKIQQIKRIVQHNLRGVPYTQDYAVMDDGSEWEVPCIGNGNEWRQTHRSLEALQLDFEQHLLACAEIAGDNINYERANQRSGQPRSGGKTKKGKA